MSQSDLVSRARSGDATAIADLISRSLIDRGIVARAEWQGDDLQILLEGDSLPQPQTLIPNLRSGFERLGVTRPIAAVRLYARRPSHDFPDWVEAFTLEAMPTPTATISTKADKEQPTLPVAAGPTSNLPDSPPTPYLSDTALIVLVHLAPLLGYLVGVGQSWVGFPFFWGASFLLPWRILPPLALLLVKGKESTYIQTQSREALNFQLSLTLYWLITLLLMLVLVGFLLVIPLAFFEGVCVVIAAVKIADGKSFHYPLTIRFIK
ncbi:MAG TPA: DUF4870 domain-containing protein [Trichocoleus sp.]